ncbi:MAG: inositol monophosphatase family protein [Nocardioidaceae bacterium]
MSELRSVAVRIAREAAELARTRRAQGVEVVATKSSEIDIVTATDRETEDLVRARLAELRPGDAILGEEGGQTFGDTDVTWIVDPIDGTVNFLYGIPQYAVSIAARRRNRAGDDQVVAGAVVNAATGETYSAALGEGATLDGRPIAVRPAPPMPQRLIATGFWYVHDVRVRQGEAVARLLTHVRDIRRMGSCALDLCAVAAGSLDGYVEEGPAPWDYSAGGLIATEAGARLELHRGTSGHDTVVCAPEAGFDEFLAVVRGAGFLEFGAGE